MKIFKKLKLSLWLFAKLAYFTLAAGIVFLPLARASVPERSGFFWRAAKEGKTFHILGTFHHGSISLKKDFLCSLEIIEKIKTSDYLFTEVPLTEEQGKLLISPKKEREKILSQMPPEKREEIINIKKKLTQDIQNLLPPLYSEGGSFEDLHPKTQEFLISHVDIEGQNYTDYFLSLSMILTIKNILSDKSMDSEILNIALSQNIPFEVLARASFLSQAQKTKKIKKVNKLTLDNLVGAIKRGRSFSKTDKDLIQEIVEWHNKVYETELKYIISVILPPLLKQILLIDRNPLWLKQFKQAYRNENISSVFIAGGLAHFIGSHNLIDSLKKEGFRIHRLACFKGRLKAIDY